MPPSKRAARPLHDPMPQQRRREPTRQIGVHVRVNGKQTLRTARVVVYRKHIEMVLAGFEVDDLDILKDEHPMKWDKSDGCWILARWDLDQLLTDLERMRFIVRVFDAD